MGKIEKTLELNITHELLSLADSFWWFLQPITLKKIWNPHFKIPIIKNPKPFATGLAISDEGKKGGGWDVCINSPSIFKDKTARLLYLQFKAGNEKQYSTNKKSHFYGSAKNPKLHIEFTINNNTHKNQHKLLKELAKKSGNGNAVAYVFPRIVTEKQMQSSLGALCKKTSFITIEEIDKKAAAKGINIDDKISHSFKTDYSATKSEVNWWWFDIGSEEKPGGIIGEIFSIRVYRALIALKSTLETNNPVSKTYLVDAIIRYIVLIGRHYDIRIELIQESLSELRFISSRIKETIKEVNYSEDINLKNEIVRSEFKQRVFQNIIEKLKPYLDLLNSKNKFTADTIIPSPPNEYTIELNDEINITLNDDDEFSEIGEIWYQII